MLATLAVVGLAVFGYGWWTYHRINRVDLDLAEISESGPQNYLVVGSDSRADVQDSDPNAGVMLGDGQPSGQRSDSIAVLRVDPAEERVDVLSIPRDLWVTLPTGEEQRINAAYADSVQTLIDTIDDNLGIPVHHFVEVDFTGFQRLIDALGGVPMYFDAEVRDVNSGLRIREPGCHVLDGPAGLAFARSRHLQWKDAAGWHTDGSGDLGRIARQQALMRAALARSDSMGLDDLGRLEGLVDAGLDSTTIDSGLGVREMMALGRRFAHFDPQRLQTHSLTVTPERTAGGAAVVRLDEAASASALALFRGSSEPSAVTTTTVPLPTPGDVAVAVYNGGAPEGEARRVSYVLAAGDFRIGEVDTAEDPVKRTTVAHAPGGEAMGELVASWLGPGPKLVVDEDLEAGQVRITLGPDFDSVAEPAAGAAADDGGAGGTGTGGTGSSSTAGTPSTAPSTTTTTVPGWIPGAAPAGVDCS